MDAVPRIVNAAGFLSPSGPKLWTIPAGAPFLERLAGAIAEAVDLQRNPDALVDAVIYLPNRRSVRALTGALHEQMAGGEALLAPQVRALGDLETDDPPAGLDGPFAELGPPLSASRRIGALMAMVRAWFAARGHDLPIGSAHTSARELASLLDEAAMSGEVDWSKLSGLAGQAELAAHWSESVAFLEIVTEHWPAWLAQNDALDPLSRRLEMARLIAAGWARNPPKGPVIIAGSTGATAASRILMQAARGLQRSAIVLPGLDMHLDAEEQAAIRAAPNHPQHALLLTLDHLACAPGDITPIKGEADDGQDARRALIHESLSPAELTGDWTGRLDRLAAPGTPDDFARRGLAGLNLVAARDETDEALIAACLMRASLAEPGATAALVTSDASLARRVSAQLTRWGVHAAPSEGTPLLRTPQGIFIDALLDWWAQPADPVAVAALLHAPFIAPPMPPASFDKHALRGPKWWRDLSEFRGGLSARLAKVRKADRLPEEEREELCALAEWLEEAWLTLGAEDAIDAATWRARLSALLDRVCDRSALWRGMAGSKLADLIDQLVELAEPLGPLRLEEWRELARTLARDLMVAPETQGHPRLSIWGPLEARLQSADHLILAGLNGDVWPARISPDIFLPRHFKAALGLPDPDERLGLAAHDFASLACAPRVTLLYSDRREDAPAVASRWVWRLKTLAEGALGPEASSVLAPSTGSDPRIWARALRQAAAAADPVNPVPKPTPPIHARPKQLSVTRINVLQRDPYAIYCESVLKLKQLDSLGRAIDPRETGTAVHAALEAFDLEREKTAETLLALMETELRKAGERDASLSGRRAVLRQTAKWYADWLSGRQAGLARLETEIYGTMEIQLPSGPFTLSALADRIELRSDGALAIIDFKTGAPPTEKVIAAGLEQQMPLQALIAAEGGFKPFGPRDVSELTYVAFKARPEIRMVGAGKMLTASPGELAGLARDGLLRLLHAYENEDQPYLSAPRVQFVGYDSGYNRLARRAEWVSEVSDD